MKQKKADWIVIRSPSGELVALEDKKKGLFNKLMAKKADIICLYANGTISDAIEWAKEVE